MNYKREFVISFGGLKVGNHGFDFEIGQRFFDEFEYSEIKNGNLSVALQLEKQNRLLQFTFHISGNVEVVCDRCLDPFLYPVSGTYVLYVKFGNEFLEESEDVIVLPESQTQIDLCHYIYEFIILLVPYRHVHPDDEQGNSGCDPVVLKKLEELSSGHHSDLLWEKLKDLEIDQQ